jgi:hypothetical protein
MIVGVRHTKFGHMQTRRLSAADRLQHVFWRQRGSGLMAQSERIFEELENLGLGLQFCGALAVLDGGGDRIAGEQRPDEVVRRTDVFDLRRE